MPRVVYVLQHMYAYGKENEHEESKFLGIYSTREKAVAAKSNYYKLQGFDKYPEECFYIEKYVIDEYTGWQEGFISWEEA